MSVVSPSKTNLYFPSSGIVPRTVSSTTITNPSSPSKLSNSGVKLLMPASKLLNVHSHLKLLLLVTARFTTTLPVSIKLKLSSAAATSPLVASKSKFWAAAGLSPAKLRSKVPLT